MFDQGHKKCKEVLTNNPQRGNIAPETQTDAKLVRPESLWSLRRGRSVRLEHWGDWIAYEDQNAQSVFWYNHVAQKSQWVAPSGVCEANSNHFANSSMRLKREGDWIEYTLPDGNVFYYNDKNNEFQWERPDQLSPRSASEECFQIERFDGDTAAEATVGDWAPFKDPSTGLVFWYNHVTGESRWEPPHEVGTYGEAQRETPIVPEEDVREVNSVDDLFTPR